MCNKTTQDERRVKGRTGVVLGFFFLYLINLPLEAQAQDITIRGATFYKNGSPWLAKGIQIEGFNEPPNLRIKSKIATEAQNYWGPAEIAAIKQVFGADTVRFQVSQPGLDPQSPIYDQTYAPELITVIKQARAADLIVIVSMDAQGENGIEGLPCMPNQSTVRAWETLAPPLAHDNGIMLDVFNEPCKTAKPEDKAEWAQGTQAVIDALRRLGSENIILVEGLHFARTTSDLFPLVHDALKNRLALAVHPYSAKGWFESREQWDREFGFAAAKFPTIADEWNALAVGGGCSGDLPDKALSLIRYLQEKHIGIVGWAIDSHTGKLVVDHDKYEPTSYDYFKSCNDGSGSGAGRLIAKFPNN
jgi:hypothetical protein